MVKLFYSTCYCVVIPIVAYNNMKHFEQIKAEMNYQLVSVLYHFHTYHVGRLLQCAGNLISLQHSFSHYKIDTFFKKPMEIKEGFSI